MGNPFTLTFGKVPQEYIERISIIDGIIDSFTGDNPDSQAYVISGVRGSGKTVMLADITNRLSKDDSWIIIDLMPQVDMVNKAIADLYNVPTMKIHFADIKFSVSLPGIDIGVEKPLGTNDPNSVLEEMLRIAGKQGKKVLFSIDEVETTRYMKIFCTCFQLYVRHELPVYMLMTGLDHNINNLSHSDGLTFLLRTPRVEMLALNITRIASSYSRILGLSVDDSWKLAITTKGYSYAFQVLGTLAWNKRDEVDKTTIDDFIGSLLPEYDHRLQEYVYAKVWEDCSPTEKAILLLIGDDKPSKVSDLRLKMNDMVSNKFNVYRDRLIRKGILISPERGTLEFALPRFAEYIKYYAYI